MLFDAAVDAFGSVDIAVNCLGKVIRRSIVETSEAEYDEVFAVNAKAAYFFLREAGRRLNSDGSVISIGSPLLHAFAGEYSTYAGAKSAVSPFTRAAAWEFGARGINVNEVTAGPRDTPYFYHQHPPEWVQFHSTATHQERVVFNADIAPLVVFLADEGRWITGQSIVAAGAYAPANKPAAGPDPG